MDECGVAVGGDGVGSDHFCFRVKAEVMRWAPSLLREERACRRPYLGSFAAWPPTT